MQNLTTESFVLPSASPKMHDPLTDVLRHGARQMLIQAVEAEAAAWIDDHAHNVDQCASRSENRCRVSRARIDL